MSHDKCLWMDECTIVAIGSHWYSLYWYTVYCSLSMYPMRVRHSFHPQCISNELQFVCLGAERVVNSTGEEKRRSRHQALISFHCWKETKLDLRPPCTAASLQGTEGWICKERTAESLIMHRYSTWRLQRTDKNTRKGRKEKNKTSSGMQKIGWAEEETSTQVNV